MVSCIQANIFCAWVLTHGGMHTGFFFFFCRMLLFMLIRTNISTLLLRLPNGWCGTEWWQPGWHEYPPWNTTASQMPCSRLQDYLSLNKLHYGFYYPGTHSRKKPPKTKQQHFAGLLFTQGPCALRAMSTTHHEEELNNRGRRCKTRGGRFILATFASEQCRNNLDWDINQFVLSPQY